MEIFSSFYDKAVNLNENDYTMVRVSRTAPPDSFMQAIGSYVDLSDMFGPTTAMLEECDPLQEKWQAFEPRYIEEILGVLDKTETLNRLQEIHHDNGDKPLLLLCYETAQEHCHRQLIGDYLGIEIHELD